MSHQSDLIAEDINAYLAQHKQKELLRFLTCGSVDDGKSTLIGRLLHDSKMIYEDQLAAIQSDTQKHGTTGEKLDLALLVDGLAAEREQGITIDVAYRYFSTEKRKFIIADTPGHEQYTRNMATGASTCDLAIILIDARHGVMTQTRRHSYIASLLGIKHLVVAVNKMDLVGFDQARFNSIVDDYRDFAKSLNLESKGHTVTFVPISALDGDNVVNRSQSSPWYLGQTLMELLELVPVECNDQRGQDSHFRYPIQYVNRPNLDFRGFCGTVASGQVAVGDAVKVLPSGKSSAVKDIITYDGSLNSAHAGQAVTLTLTDEIDISRGDILVKADDSINAVQYIQAHLVWMSETAMQPGKVYDFKFASRQVSGQFSDIAHRIDVNTQEKSAADQLGLNDIALVRASLSQPVVVDAYESNRVTGAFIVIDRLTNATVAAGMIESALGEISTTKTQFSDFELELNALVRKHFPHWNALDISALK